MVCRNLETDKKNNLYTTFSQNQVQVQVYFCFISHKTIDKYKKKKIYTHEGKWRCGCDQRTQSV